MSKINIHYFYNSGFSIETSNSILIFDYYRESANTFENAYTVENLLSKEKPVYVFVSHNHSDHLNNKIFTWNSKNTNVKYILSNDIKPKNMDNSYSFVKKNDTLTLDNLTIKVFGSTDAGVSFLVDLDGFNIFHAGDLNWWHWKEDSEEDNTYAEKWFKEEISCLAGEKIDLAFFPVDPRQAEYYYLGGQYFIENINPKYFIPMHFGNDAEIINSFKNKVKDYPVTVLDISKKDIELSIL